MKCSRCKRGEPEVRFHKNQTTCVPCQDDIRRARRHALRAAGELTDHQKYRRRLRWLVLSHYSGGGDPFCDCCGEKQFEFLAIDHVGGGGCKHRKALLGRHLSVYTWLRDQGFPKGFRVLCHNCNQAIGMFGFCPHKLSPEELERLKPPTRSRAERCQDKILAAALEFHSKGIYPSIPKLAQVTGCGNDVLVKYRNKFAASGQWPTEIQRQNRTSKNDV